jgi:hypothetical protein
MEQLVHKESKVKQDPPAQTALMVPLDRKGYRVKLELRAHKEYRVKLDLPEWM